jgi:hypothetical protein
MKKVGFANLFLFAHSRPMFLFFFSPIYYSSIIPAYIASQIQCEFRCVFGSTRIRKNSGFSFLFAFDIKPRQGVKRSQFVFAVIEVMGGWN